MTRKEWAARRLFQAATRASPGRASLEVERRLTLPLPALAKQGGTTAPFMRPASAGGEGKEGWAKGARREGRRKRG